MRVFDNFTHNSDRLTAYNAHKNSNNHAKFNNSSDRTRLKSLEQNRQNALNMVIFSTNAIMDIG